MKAAFLTGYIHGLAHGEATAREAETLHPEYTEGDVDAYCMGTVDGARGDRWRIDRLCQPSTKRTHSRIV